MFFEYIEQKKNINNLEKYKMTTFEIHFILNGIPYQEIIETTNTYRAKQLLLSRYPSAKITLVRQV